MFTGIVEEMGTIKEINTISSQAIQLTVSAKEILTDINVGDSIAVNGICLTVTNFTDDQFQVDAMPETMKSTSLSMIDIGSKVNVERSMPANGRFGGHFVSGHVDEVGKIILKEKQENAIYYNIQISEAMRTLTILKGSIAIDGVSLTIFARNEDTITLSLIPHTVSETVLGTKEEGDAVNIEYDMFAKYIYQMVEESNIKPLN